MTSPQENKFRPYSVENLTPHTGNRTRPYEVPEFEGSETLEGVKSGLRDTARLVPSIGKVYTEAEKSNELTPGKAVAKSTKFIAPGVDVFLKGASAIYDKLPSFFGKTHEQVKLEKGEPLPESVTKSKRYRIGEFVGMEAPFAAIDVATGGISKIARYGLRPVINKSLRNLSLKEAYYHGAYRGAAKAGKNITTGSVSQELEERGLPRWASDLLAIGTGHYAVPAVVDKSGTYLLNKATNYVLSKRSKLSGFNITPTWANTSDGAMAEVALGVLQKDLATRNTMKEFVASQEQEFKTALMDIIDADAQMTTDAEGFLTDILETKSNELANQESALAQQEQSLGQEVNALQLENKAIQTNAAETRESAQELIEDIQPPKRLDTTAQRKEIIKKATENLPETEIEVSDQIIANSAKRASSAAQTPQDQEAVQILNSIPVTTESATRAVEAIYDNISPRIGQPEAGDIYKARREQAYQLANQEKRELYGELANAANSTGYVIPESQFNSMIRLVDDQIKTLQSLPFLSPTQQRALSKLNDLRGSFEVDGQFFDMGDGIKLPVTEVPNLMALWEIRKSLGQSINWKSNLPGEKILKDQYHKFNNALEKQLKNAGLLDKYNTANEMYIQRFLPLEQGTNGKVRFMNPQEAGRVLNLNAIQALSPFLPLEDLNPLRRYAIERVVGMPKTGEIGTSQIQRLENVRRYLTPAEQSQFNSLSDIKLIKAKVSLRQLEKIENFIESNKSNLTKEVQKSLEAVASELRANATLPVDYITGRAQLAEIERLADEQYEALHGLQKAQKKELKRESRKVSKKAGETRARIEEETKKIKEKLREVSKEKRNILAQQQRLQKSFLGTILQTDTNRALLIEMSTPDGIKQVKELLGDSPMGRKILEELKLKKAQQIFENAASISSIGSLLKNENSRILLKELLPSDQFNRLISLSELAKSMQEKLRYFVNNSNTAVQVSNVKTLKEMLSASISLLTKGTAEAAGRLISKTIIPAGAKKAVAKAMTSPEFLRRLEDFFQSLKNSNDTRKQINAANKLLSVLGTIATTVGSEREPDKNNKKNKHI